jgi:hypothetical protein
MNANRRPGDWDCPSCNYLNFASRVACQSCSKPKPSDGYADGYGSVGGGVSGMETTCHQETRKFERKEGDWDCPTCQHMNFAKRDSCRSCGTLKEGINNGHVQQQQDPTTKRAQDWACLGCNFENFGRNIVCLRCRSPRMMVARGGFSGTKSSGNDWACSCGEIVFGSRFACRNCGTPRSSVTNQTNYAPVQPSFVQPYGGGYPSNFAGGYSNQPGLPLNIGGSRQPLKPGDWLCTCGEHVFGSKESCRKCGALKPKPSSNYVPTTQVPKRYDERPGDWECECGFSNFAHRTECKRCNKKRST